METHKILISALLALSLCGCAGGIGRVKYIDTNSKEYVSAGFDLNDIKKALQESLDSLFKSGFFQKLSSSSPVVLAISDFVNDTTIKFDVEQITARMGEELQNSGKFQITRAISGSGGNTDSMIYQSRKSRDNEEFNQETVIEKDSLLSPSLSLTGKIGQRIMKVGDDQRIDYFFRIEINEIKTGLSRWSKTIDISKISEGNASIW